MPRLSVIITTFNRDQLLPRAIESIRNPGVDSEIIVVDDASTDETREYCEGVAGIKYIRQEQNQGTAAARNAGILASSAPYIAFLDDDDWRLPGTFYSQLSLLDKDKSCGLVYGKVLFSNQDNELTGDSTVNHPSPQGDVLLELLKRNFITLSSVVVRRECFDKVGMFDNSPKMLGLEDWDMWLRLSGYYSVMAINEPVAVYRRPDKDSGQWYSDLGRQFSMAADAYKQKWFQLPGVRSKLGKEFAASRKEILAHASDIILYHALNNSNNIREKGSRFRAAVKCWPKNLVQLRFYKAVAKAILNRA
ncbi:MAG: glycosyltransferase family 2 protein [Chitinophagaceae bacterium]